jgi:hypothetical protein
LYLSHLTVEQYANSVRELLGLDVRLLIRFGDAAGRDFIKGAYITQIQVDQRLATAELIAADAVSTKNLPILLGRIGCDLQASGASACGNKLVDTIGRRAFRRALDIETRTDMRQLFDAGLANGGFADGAKAFLAGLLQAPDFLYQIPITAPRSGNVGKPVRLDDWAIASRLSYFLWNSMPDETLLGEAAASRLQDPVAIEKHVRRMVRDGLARKSRDEFVRTWLGVDNLPAVPHSESEFTPALAADLEASLLAGINAAYDGDARFDTLIGGNTLHLNGRLAALYSPGRASGAELRPVAVDRSERRGLMTHPALMALLAGVEGGDPIRRGKFVRIELLCESVPPLPDADPPPTPHTPGLSRRQQLEEHTGKQPCLGCHQLMNPAGFAFGNYDALGRYQTKEGDFPVDSSGEIFGGGDVAGKFSNGMQLFDRMATSKTVRQCFATHWYRYAQARPLVEADVCAVEGVKRRFASSGDLVDLYVSIATSESFVNRLEVE